MSIYTFIGEYNDSDSSWARSFHIGFNVNVLIVCRGPIRLEAMQVFERLGSRYGILLSEKDSVTYTHTLAPELRIVRSFSGIHRIADYSAETGEGRRECIQKIISIVKTHYYTHVFAGYGFMAEDAEFVEALEQAGIGFIGPASQVHRLAGAKDMAKTIARQLKVSVTPGVDNITALTLLSKAQGKLEKLEQLAKQQGIDLQAIAKKQKKKSGDWDLETYAEAILQQGYSEAKNLISTQELQSEAQKQGGTILKQNPGRRLRLKYIGGGGGKGQRIVETEKQIPNAVMEILSEAKALGEADNKNFLLELNIESTRHNEIQLLGNGDWCVALGGRDCSLQMHEQKLVELSLTDELFSIEIEKAKKQNADKTAQVLEKDRLLLQEMEDQAMCFGKKVGLNSASTFEAIVTGDTFYFMEMNTRIQVEHRVTEMAYKLRFCNPDDDEDFFEVYSLVEAMALIAVHGKRLPCPERIKRHAAGGEIRLNAQNEALQPAAGGNILFWSPPTENELRDDQGIGIRNPDNGDFIHYHLAGAYDSNIALIVSAGEDRSDNLTQLANILRCMEMRGPGLQTNQDFHYGILNFGLGFHPFWKPTTTFVSHYLRAVGSLALELQKVDWQHAYKLLQAKAQTDYGKEGQDVFARKQTLLLRPLEILQARPHLCAGWLMRNWRRAFAIVDKKWVWRRNPWYILADLYHYLRLEKRDSNSPIQQVWDHDYVLLQQGLEFYNLLEQEYLQLNSEANFQQSISDYSENQCTIYTALDALLRGQSDRQATSISLSALNETELQNCASAHAGWQLGSDLLLILLSAARRSNILSIEMKDDLSMIFPDCFLDETKQEDYLRVLSPPPKTSADLIVAASGGMFYARESPESPPYLEVGKHFSVGDPIYIIEVMKMFNKVCAEFSGTVVEILVKEEQNKVVKKGQALFRVKPDKPIYIESEEEKQRRRHAFTEELWAEIII